MKVSLHVDLLPFGYVHMIIYEYLLIKRCSGVIKETITLYLLYLFTEVTVQGADFTHHIEYLGANLKLNKQISISFIGYVTSS